MWIFNVGLTVMIANKVAELLKLHKSNYQVNISATFFIYTIAMELSY
jgi:hypothetical protein